MKTKLFSRDDAEKNNRIKESLLSVGVEAAAWLLAGGLILGALKVAAFLFAGHES